MDHQAGSDGDHQPRRSSRNRRRRRLRSQFENSRRRRHDPPPDPEQWEPDPTWKHILRTLWDNPMLLVLVAIMIAVVLYILFPPSWLVLPG